MRGLSGQWILSGTLLKHLPDDWKSGRDKDFCFWQNNIFVPIYYYRYFLLLQWNALFSMLNEREDNFFTNFFILPHFNTFYLHVNFFFWKCCRNLDPSIQINKKNISKYIPTPFLPNLTNFLQYFLSHSLTTTFRHGDWLFNNGTTAKMTNLCAAFGSNNRFHCEGFVKTLIEFLLRRWNLLLVILLTHWGHCCTASEWNNRWIRIRRKLSPRCLRLGWSFAQDEFSNHVSRIFANNVLGFYSFILASVLDGC